MKLSLQINLLLRKERVNRGRYKKAKLIHFILRGDHTFMKNNTTHPISSSSQPNRTYLKLTWKVIYHLKRQPYFFLANLYLKQVLARRMSWLTSFAWRYSTCGMCEPRITKWKIFLSTVGFEPRSFCLRSEGAKRWAIRADKNLSLKFEPLSLVKVMVAFEFSESYGGWKLCLFIWK